MGFAAVLFFAIDLHTYTSCCVESRVSRLFALHKFSARIRRQERQLPVVKRPASELA